MQFEEMGNMSGKTLMLLPGTCCNWQTNFGTVIPDLSEKYHLICVNYDGFDGSDDIFPDMITVTEFNPESIKNEFYTDLLTHLEDDINIEHTKAHFIYAKKMGEKYLKRYKKYFHNPDIREFDMQHEQWLFGGKKYAEPVLKAIDEFMEMAV